MTPDWTPLQRELDRWAGAGLTLPLWWRDDDAVAATPALARLADLSDRLALPVHLAVIPSGADDTLAETLRRRPRLVPLVHGWAHENHAPQGEKKAEFGAHRPLAAMTRQIETARTRLAALLGHDPAPIFVPPWNRIAPDLAATLPGLGFRALSTFTPRSARFAAPGLEQINTHLDPIDWRAGKVLVAPDRLVSQIAAQLADRRTGRADNREPYGILTHHLVHDEDIWTFTETLLARLMAGPVRAWQATEIATGKDTTDEPT